MAMNLSTSWHDLMRRIYLSLFHVGNDVLSLFLLLWSFTAQINLKAKIRDLAYHTRISREKQFWLKKKKPIATFVNFYSFIGYVCFMESDSGFSQHLENLFSVARV